MSTTTESPCDQIPLAQPALNDRYRVGLGRGFEVLSWLDSLGATATFVHYTGRWTIGLKFEDFKRIFSGQPAKTEIKDGRKYYDVEHDGVLYMASVDYTPVFESEVL